MYDRVIVPTGVDDSAERTVERALDVAQRYDAELHVLRVADSETTDAETPATDPHDVRSAPDERSGVPSGVEERAVAGGANVVSTVRRGPPTETIRRYADESGDSVLLRERGGFCEEPYRAGGVVGRCLRESPHQRRVGQNRGVTDGGHFRATPGQLYPRPPLHRVWNSAASFGGAWTGRDSKQSLASYKRATDERNYASDFSKRTTGSPPRWSSTTSGS